MKRSWISLALLSASWLFGLSYYHGAQSLVWAVLVAAGAILLAGVPIRVPTGRQSWAAMAMLLPIFQINQMIQ